MNNKKYMSMGFLGMAIMIAMGVAYYFYPVAINNMIGIGPAQGDTVSDVDLPALDDASSSLPVVDPVESAGTAAASSMVTKKSVQKLDSIAKPDAPTEKSNAAQGQDAESDESTVASSSLLSQADDGDVTDTVSVNDGGDASSSVVVAPCSFPGGAPSTTRNIIFNEIAWMGSPSSSNAEWMEVKNNSADAVDLSGWELMNASGKIKISFSSGDAIAGGGFLVLARESAGAIASGGAVATPGAKIYSGDLVNGGDVLALIDPHCGVSDYLDASHGWPGGNNTTKQTLERDADGVGWHTSALPGGTPGVENSAGPPTTQYKLIVAFGGDASGATIKSNPVGLTCAASCTGSFASGTQITLVPAAGVSTTFGGWSGLCYGETTCSFVISANTSLSAQFNAPVAPASSVANGDTGASGGTDNALLSTSGATSTASSSLPATPADADNSDTNNGNIGGTAVSASHILISTVQIADASSSNDLVKLYNPTGVTVDMSGWKLHKKSQTGTDYSLKVFPAGSTIDAGQSFVWANSADGFSETIVANVSSTETLAADNSVALMDAAGNIVDAVAWGTGTSQYGEGPPYPTSPGVNQLLSRRSSGGVMVDTDNNTNDFILQ